MRIKRSFAVFVTLLVMILVSACDNSRSNSSEQNSRLSVGTKAVVADKDRSVTFSISRWGASYNGTVTITNKGTEPITEWTLSFDWDHTIKSYWSSELVSVTPINDPLKTGNTYKFKHKAWNSDIAPGKSLSFGFGGDTGGSTSDPSSIVVTTSSGPVDPTDPGAKPVLPAGPSSELSLVYKTMTNDTSKVVGTLLLGNVNTGYYWDASCFAIRNITFETSSKVTSIKKIPYGAAAFTQVGNLVTMELGYPSMLGYSESLEFSIECDKVGTSPEPANFVAHYMRGDDIRYNNYGDLPATWSKNKANLTSADLIVNPAEYYKSNLTPQRDDFIIYNPSSATQIQIGQVYAMDYPVNTEKGVRIYMYSKYMAMGVGLVYEFLKINPNYMTALGTKENYAAGFIKTGVGVVVPVTIEGEQYYWPMVAHSDGPYQQEPGNFDDAKKHMYDYLGPDAKHGELIRITVNPNDPNFITSGFSSGLSISVTRELLNAIDNSRFNEFIDNAADPNAELVCVTYAYNRGVNAFLGKGILGSNRTAALATPDLVSRYDMGGFGAHVPTVRAIVNRMNESTDIYDEQLSWADMELFFTQLRKFYAKGIPSTTEWAAMIADVKKAFDVLKLHWGGQTVSYRYDFLTLLRVAKKHLPDTNPRPTGDHWYYNVKNSNLN